MCGVIIQKLVNVSGSLQKNNRADMNVCVLGVYR